MPRVYLGLGSNLGNKAENIATALQLIAQQIGEVTAHSAAMESAPMGFRSENNFLNGVAAVETDLPLLTLLDVTQQIERQMGRTHKSVNHQYRDRIIDIDILLYDDLAYADERIVVPHPAMKERPFVMDPLAEIAPELAQKIKNGNFSC